MGWDKTPQYKQKVVQWLKQVLHQVAASHTEHAYFADDLLNVG